MVNKFLFPPLYNRRYLIEIRKLISLTIAKEKLKKKELLNKLRKYILKLISKYSDEWMFLSGTLYLSLLIQYDLMYEEYEDLLSFLHRLIKYLFNSLHYLVDCLWVRGAVLSSF